MIIGNRSRPFHGSQEHRNPAERGAAALPESSSGVEGK